MATTTKTKLAAPKSLAEFLRLMQEHANKRVSWDEVVELLPDSLFMGLFWSHYFTRRERITIGELIPYVQYRGIFCDNVPQLVAEVLIKRKVIEPDYEVIAHVPLSTKKLPKQYRLK